MISIINIKDFTKSILSDSEILSLTGNNKVYFLYAPKPVSPYVIYGIYDEQGAEWAEGKEIATSYYVQVDIFSKKEDYSELEEKIKEKMINADFIRGMCADLYEDDTQLFHKAMRFSISANV